MQGGFERRLRPTRLTAGARNGTLAPLATSAKRSWGRFGHRLAGLRPAEMKGAVEAPSEESQRRRWAFFNSLLAEKDLVRLPRSVQDGL